MRLWRRATRFVRSALLALACAVLVLCVLSFLNLWWNTPFHASLILSGSRLGIVAYSSDVTVGPAPADIGPPTPRGPVVTINWANGVAERDRDHWVATTTLMDDGTPRSPSRLPVRRMLDIGIRLPRLALILAAPGLLLLLVRTRPRPGHCPACEYDRVGLDASLACPECGFARTAAPA